MSQQQETRVMEANALVTLKEYGPNKHQQMHHETIFCGGHLCTPADPLHPDTVKFIRENKEA